MASTNRQCLSILLLYYIVNVISQNNYFIDRYNDANEGIIYISYPNGHCTLTSNQSPFSYSYYECESNTNSFDCDYNADNTCLQNGAICLPSNSVNSYNPSLIPFNTLNYGQCPDDLFGINNNYTQIALYSSSKSSNDDCPLNTDFTLSGKVYIATNICVQQADSSYLMMTCDGFTAQMSVYNDNICTQFNHTLIQYSRLCDYYTDNGLSKMYRRLEGCYINNNNQLQPTPNPTSYPTINPTSPPTVNPTSNPTSNPTTNPTLFPTFEPTIYPTHFPSFIPTIDPTIYPTLYPIITPTTSESNKNTIPGTASVISDLNNITLMFIIFIVLFIFYLFICFYIWCNERRKRRYLTFNFQKGNDIDREARIQYLREHNLANGDNNINDDGASINGSVDDQLNEFNNNNQNVVFIDDREALMNEGYMD